VTKVYTISLGCRLNQSEMLALSRSVAAAGGQMVPSAELADVIVMNSCAVTHEAERKSRQAIRRLRRIAPHARIVVTGCYAELDPTLGQAANSADLVLGNRQKHWLLDNPREALSIRQDVAVCMPESEPWLRTRGLVRVQEGCDNRCTYCLVWRLRGPHRSRAPHEVLTEVQALVNGGYKEVVLTGVHIGAYGKDLDGGASWHLWRLVRMLLEETDVSRLRLSSIEPWDLESIDLSLWQDKRLCPHLHIPLQSGSTKILERMGRKYTAAGYRALVERVREGIPDLAITTDVIVGFPGETEDDFRASLDFVSRVGFARVHVFPYSPRPRTEAADMKGQVEASVRRERAARMRAVAEAARREYAQAFVGRTVPVLWEARSGAHWAGLTPNYIRVRCESAENLRNEICDTLLEKSEGSELIGLVVA